MTSEILNKEASLPNETVDSRTAQTLRQLLPIESIETMGVFSLTRRLTSDESDFLTVGSKSKLKRAFFIRQSRLVDEALKESEHPEDVLSLLSFVSYVGQTFIKLESKGFATPEQVTSAVKGLEDLFALPVFSHGPKPVEIAFGSATFRVSDKEFYRVSYDKGKFEIQSGILTPIWNPPITVDSETGTPES